MRCSINKDHAGNCCSYLTLYNTVSCEFISFLSFSYYQHLYSLVALLNFLCCMECNFMYYYIAYRSSRSSLEKQTTRPEVGKCSHQIIKEICSGETRRKLNSHSTLLYDMNYKFTFPHSSFVTGLQLSRYYRSRAEQ